MDVNANQFRKQTGQLRRLVFFPVLFLWGCGQVDYGSAVFPETKGECIESALTNRFIVHWNDGRITVEKATDREAFVRDFLQTNAALIRRAEHDQFIQPILFANPVNTDNTPPMNWGQAMVQADKLWAQGLRGEGVLVAVVDTGLATEHPQIAPQLEINSGEIPSNGIDDDQNGYVDDTNGYNFYDNNGDVRDDIGHGTHVAGIIAAHHEFGEVLGVAPGAKILPLKFISEHGGSLGDALLAIKYAANYAQRSQRPLVINASWGGSDCSDTFTDMVSELQNHKTLFVVAAGNDGLNIDTTPEYPAALDAAMQLTVGAVTPRGYLAGFSNYGSRFVHLVAPGEEIFSTYAATSTRTLSGTSMAAPFVAGAAALLWGARKEASAQTIREALLKGVDKGPYAVRSTGALNVVEAHNHLTPATTSQ